MVRVLLFALRLIARAGAAGAVVLATVAGGAQAATVSVFPIPGSQVASPGAQIVFRGVAVGSLGTISVTGSRSGGHRGRTAGDSDRDGASFLPAKPFTPGETVTVRTRQTVLGGQGGTFHFTVAQPTDPIVAMHVYPNGRRPGDIVTFHSRPDLKPARVQVLQNTTSDRTGDIFLGPQVGPVQDGPMIVDPAGHLVWFSPVAAGSEANNVSVQRYHGQPVLTWWQGYLDLRHGVGTGHDVIVDSAYRQLATVRAANGLTADLHEFELTPAGTALITAYFPVYWSASALHGSPHARVLDAVIQEIDVKTGLLLFQWDSLDHVPLTDSELGPPRPSNDFDYFHLNSVHEDSDGTLIASSRNTWAAYKISRQDGHVIWTLGGKQSSFALGPGASFAFQHDVRVGGPGDSLVTIFDDGAGPPSIHNQSRALALRLDAVTHMATVVANFTHSPSLLSSFEGDVEPLADGDHFVGWGQQPYFTEFDSTGRIVFDGRFAQPNTTYRAFRAPWSGTPHTAPSVVSFSGGHRMTVYASWNGATNYVAWRVLGGSKPKRLHVLGTFWRTGFETRMPVPRSAYVAVQGIGFHGQTVGTSFTVRSR